MQACPLAQPHACCDGTKAKRRSIQVVCVQSAVHAQSRPSLHMVTTVVKHVTELFSKNCNHLGERRRACEAGDFPAATNELSVVPFKSITLI